MTTERFTTRMQAYTCAAKHRIAGRVALVTLIAPSTYEVRVWAEE